MAVDFKQAAASTKGGHYTVGIVGVSSSRSVWSSVERFAGILWNAPRSAMNALGYVSNGHTAIFARNNGEVVNVAGWDPERFSEVVYQQYLRGLGYKIDVSGGWRADAAMFEDSTSYMLEVEVDKEKVVAFNDYLGVLVGTKTLSPNIEVEAHYSFKPAELEKNYKEASAERNHVEYMNCGNAAFLVLCQFLYEWGKREDAMQLAEWVKLGDDKVQNFSQGRIMQLLQAQR